MAGIHRKITVLLITCVLLLAGTMTAIAEDEAGILVYNTELVTNDLDATYIEGEIPVADGQDIVVMHGILAVARKTMPETGMPAKFRIKVPAAELNKDGVTSFRVRATEGKTVPESLPVKTEITYKAREEQSIKTSENSYKLTLPGLKEKIKAKASSGEDVYYVSSDPKVVEVDKHGNLLPKGKGEAKISVKAMASSKYEATETSVSVSVEEIDAYSVTFHSSVEGDEQTSEQIIPTNEAMQLDANPFENGEHQFLGWATSDDGLVEYSNTATVQELASKGENTDLYAVWTGDGARAACAWAIQIANDDSFSYGKKPATSRVGCYFCGTNQRNKPKGYEKTYVCLTFVEAAYAHGAEDPEMLAECRGGKHCISASNSNFSTYSCWQKVGLCKNLSNSDLQPGDVVVYYTPTGYTNGHVAMYVGNGQMADAEGIRDCWGPNSIAVRNGTSMLRSAARFNSNSYVMRYCGPNA